MFYRVAYDTNEGMKSYRIHAGSENDAKKRARLRMASSGLVRKRFVSIRAMR